MFSVRMPIPLQNTCLPLLVTGILETRPSATIMAVPCTSMLPKSMNCALCPRKQQLMSRPEISLQQYFVSFLFSCEQALTTLQLEESAPSGSIGR